MNAYLYRNGVIEGIGMAGIEGEPAGLKEVIISPLDDVICPTVLLISILLIEI